MKNCCHESKLTGMRFHGFTVETMKSLSCSVETPHFFKLHQNWRNLASEIPHSSVSLSSQASRLSWYKPENLNFTLVDLISTLLFSVFIENKDSWRNSFFWGLNSRASWHVKRYDAPFFLFFLKYITGFPNFPDINDTFPVACSWSEGDRDQNSVSSTDEQHQK